MLVKNCKVCSMPTPSSRARYCDVCRPAKHKARSTGAFGKRFASGKEAMRYGELLGLAEAGKITRLNLQPRFPISVNGQLVCTYVADFSYVNKTSEFIVEDVKSKWTAKLPVYRLKIKLMKAVNRITVSEVFM